MNLLNMKVTAGKTARIACLSMTLFLISHTSETAAFAQSKEMDASADISQPCEPESTKEQEQQKKLLSI